MSNALTAFNVVQEPCSTLAKLPAKPDCYRHMVAVSDYRSKVGRPSRQGRVTAVLGPTNTGKTHLAVERMLGHYSGMIGLPLRLLAREVFDRVVAIKGKSSVALITGEEKIMPAHPVYFVCTVEAMPLDTPVAFLAVDEIQLCGDPDRGHVFTDRLLRARGDEETMFLGADTIRSLIQYLLPDAEFISRPRFSRLEYSGQRKLSRLPPRSAIVAFSIPEIYETAELIRRQRGGAAIVMGALSPATRNAQVAMYESGEVDFIVATDAIGMGLNLKVDHVAFMGLTKFDGHGVRELYPAEIAQIAGRAGRHMNDGTFGTTGAAGQINPDVVEQVTEHRFPQIEKLQWRNAALDYGSISGLLRSLQVSPPADRLRRTRENEDLYVLRTLSRDSRIFDQTKGPAAVRLLWDVCRIPDFRKTMPDIHARLLGGIFNHLITGDGVLPTDWLARHIDRVDRVDGDLDTLQNRLAHVRTWNYVANRPGWLSDPDHWRDRVREIEDRLSNALHTSLTQRFVDRRGSILARRNETDLVAAIDSDGQVLVEGEYVGELNGFSFVPDADAESEEQKNLVSAARKVLANEIIARAGNFVQAKDGAFSLSSGTESGRPVILWQNSSLARLGRGTDILSPAISLIPNELLTGIAKTLVEERLTLWLRDRIKQLLGPLLHLKQNANRDPSLDAGARGLAYQLSEHMGVVSRRVVAKQVNVVSREGRRALRGYGVRFAEHNLYMPALLKASPAKLRFDLWRLQQTEDSTVAMPNPALMSVLVDPNAPEGFYDAAGFAPCGQRAVRIDILDRLARTLRGKSRKGPFPMDPALMSTVGCGAEGFGEILTKIGFRLVEIEGEIRIGPIPRKRPQTRKRLTQPIALEKTAPHTGRKAPGRKTKPAKSTRRTPAKPIDADSPFAVLQELKTRLVKNNRPRRGRNARPKKVRSA